MNPTLKKSLNIGSWVLVIVGLFTALGFVSQEQKHTYFNSLTVNINTLDGNYFIVESDIEELVYSMGYRPGQVSIAEVDVQQLESVLRKNPSISSADVYTCIDGCLKIEIEQRKPILRVFNQSGESYYLDENGWLMPLSTKYTSRVLVATGHINEPYALRYQANMATIETFQDTVAKSQTLAGLYEVAKFISKDEFWKAQIIQIDVNEDQEMELVSRVGSHRILLGKAENLEDKFAKLMVFYKKGLSKTGWNEYSTINLKYKNQVVCSK